MRRASVFLRIVGILGVIVGIGVMIFSFVFVRPRLEAVTDQARRGLDAADKALASTGPLAGPSNSLKSLAEMGDLLPETLTALHGTLLEASHALDASGNAANQTTKGVTGIVAPKNALNVTDLNLRRTADQLRLLAGMTDQMRVSATRLRDGVARTERAFTRSGLARGGFAGLVGRTRARISDARSALDSAALPTLAALLGCALGGLYLFIGVVAIMVASAISAFSRARPGIETAPATRFPRRAA